jgi:hypothetical protein
MRHWVSRAILAILCVAATVNGQTAGSTDTNSPRTATLALQAAKIDTGTKYTLLVSGAELKTGDAAAFYKKAIEALPANLNVAQLRDWTKVPFDKLPQSEVAAFLQQAQPALQSTRQGAACKDCNWPAFRPGVQVDGLPGYRNMAYILCAKARLEIAQKRYDDAVDTLRTGITMAKHIGESPSIVQSLVGIAMESLMLESTDDLAQAKGSPNLYTGLKALPRPLIDVEKPIANELKALDSNKQYTGAVRDLLRKQMEQSYDRIRQNARRLDAEAAARQCIEAIRHYAATHSNKLPARLADITDVPLPNDPTTNKAFNYRVEGSKAILEMSPPKGGRPQDGARYEITIAP